MCAYVVWLWSPQMNYKGDDDKKLWQLLISNEWNGHSYIYIAEAFVTKLTLKLASIATRYGWRQPANCQQRGWQLQMNQMQYHGTSPITFY